MMVRFFFLLTILFALASCLAKPPTQEAVDRVDTHFKQRHGQHWRNHQNGGMFEGFEIWITEKNDIEVVFKLDAEERATHKSPEDWYQYKFKHLCPQRHWLKGLDKRSDVVLKAVYAEDHNKVYKMHSCFFPKKTFPENSGE